MQKHHQGVAKEVIAKGTMEKDNLSLLLDKLI